ncbi:hypothetical protein [Alcaligenes faecalis]|uniref:hypothetical protein n=1 Tax=Alcaligenes faecalis TaxID=511 RepID=UPI0020CCBA88|nr:hypothetical protein [Alcaligenes faecalis]MCX5596215.1 hypothetical protein [Alcaligenes faecalis]
MARPRNEAGTSFVMRVVASTQTTALAHAMIILARNNSVKGGQDIAKDEQRQGTQVQGTRAYLMPQ